MGTTKENVLSTATLVMYELIQRIKEEMPDTKYVYDEALTYETAVKQFRDNNNMNEDEQVALPLFAFKRSVLRYADQNGGIGRRSTTKKAIYNLPGELDNYVSSTLLQAEFDIDFAYITREITDLERFEVAYLSQKGFTRGEQLVVEIDELPEHLTYQVDFKENLDDKTINLEENYYKVISGKFTIRGYFLVFKGQVHLIKSIGLKISTYEKELLQTIPIPT